MWMTVIFTLTGQNYWSKQAFCCSTFTPLWWKDNNKNHLLEELSNVILSNINCLFVKRPFELDYTFGPSISRYKHVVYGTAVQPELVRARRQSAEEFMFNFKAFSCRCTVYRRLKLSRLWLIDLCLSPFMVLVWTPKGRLKLRKHGPPGCQLGAFILHPGPITVALNSVVRTGEMI